jgi:hypothetical protein
VRLPLELLQVSQFRLQPRALVINQLLADFHQLLLQSET